MYFFEIHICVLYILIHMIYIMYYVYMKCPICIRIFSWKTIFVGGIKIFFLNNKIIIMIIIRFCNNISLLEISGKRDVIGFLTKIWPNVPSLNYDIVIFYSVWVLYINTKINWWKFKTWIKVNAKLCIHTYIYVANCNILSKVDFTKII